MSGYLMITRQKASSVGRAFGFQQPKVVVQLTHMGSKTADQGAFQEKDKALHDNPDTTYLE